MGWQAVARGDLRSGVRSRGLWLVVGVAVVTMLVLGRFVSRGRVLTGAVLFETNARTFGLLLTLLFAPVLGLVVGNGALSHGRTAERGDAGDKLSARDRFIGTVLGRTGVLAVALLAAFAPVAVAWVVQSGPPALYELLVTVLAALALGLLFVAVGIALSTVTADRRLAALGGAGAFGLLYAWPLLPALSGVGVPFAVLDRFWLVLVVGDVADTLFALREARLTDSVTGLVVLGALVGGLLAVSYRRFSRRTCG